MLHWCATRFHVFQTIQFDFRDTFLRETSSPILKRQAPHFLLKYPEHLSEPYPGLKNGLDELSMTSCSFSTAIGCISSGLFHPEKSATLLSTDSMSFRTEGNKLHLIYHIHGHVGARIFHRNADQLSGSEHTLAVICNSWTLRHMDLQNIQRNT